MMERPKIEDWVIQEGEETEDMPIGAFLPNAYREALNKYIDQLQAEVKELKEKVKRVEGAQMSDDELYGLPIITRESLRKQRNLTLKALEG